MMAPQISGELLMSISKNWEVLPASDFAVQSSWRKIGKNRFFALRARLLIVRTDGRPARDGSPTKSYPITPDTLSLRTMRQIVLSRTDTITQAIKFSVTERVLDQLSTKISAELSGKVPGFSGKLGSSIMAKSEYEITKSTESSLSSTTSFMFQQTQEEELVMGFTKSDIPRTAYLRRRYWPRRWNIYLHSYEALELEYKRTWFWRRVRETIKSADLQVVGWPLASVLFYEPQDDHVVSFEDPVPDQLETPETIEVQGLTDAMPSGAAPQLEALSELAKLAFPTTKEEKAKAGQRKKLVGVAVKKAAKKAAAKKAVARRAHAKKAAKKAPARKTAAKKAAAKKAPAKKKAKRR
jgi:hypothetical protein